MSKFSTNLSARQRAGLFTGIFGLLFNLLLASAKIVTGLTSNSIAISSDGINNLLDSFSALTIIISFLMSSKKKDKDHPHGHGRSEYVGGFVISFFILITAIALGQQSVNRIINPEAVQTSPALFAVLVVSVLIKLAMAIVYSVRNKKIKSTILSASVRDSLSDAFTTATIVLAVIIAPISSLPIDGLISLLVVAFIARQGLISFFENLTFLLGKNTDPKTLREIRRVIRDTKSFGKIASIDFHDYGPENRSAIVKTELASGADKNQVERDINTIKEKLKSEYDINVVIYWPPNI